MPESDFDTISASPDGTPHESQPAWRKDFPIDWSLDEYRSRREFVEFLMSTSAAFVAGQFWIVLLQAFRSNEGKPAVESIADVDELPVGGSKLFEYPHPGNFCILIRLNETEFVAYGQKCTHLSCPVLRVRRQAGCIVRVTTDGSTSKTGRQWRGRPAGLCREWAWMSGTAKSMRTVTSKALYENEGFRSEPARHNHRGYRGICHHHRGDAIVAIHGDDGGVPKRSIRDSLACGACEPGHFFVELGSILLCARP